jgi:hypothetical protein
MVGAHKTMLTQPAVDSVKKSKFLTLQPPTCRVRDESANFKDWRYNNMLPLQGYSTS